MAHPTIEDFRAEATGFLDANAEVRLVQKFAWGEGSDRVGILEEKTPEEELAQLRDAKQWRSKAFDAGFGWISGPVEYGGRGLPAEYDRAYRELESRYAIPDQTPFGIGLGMIAPTILAHAIPEVKEQYLRRLHRGDIVACQLFSEPVAGSDLAGVQTRAVRDGDEWIVSGQKVWTSGAQYSDIGEIITRTDPDKPKHKGLTMFVVDMNTKGVDVRPLRQMTGGASFNEVFFDEVRIPDSHRLGDVDEGWGVALTTLMNERAAIGGGGLGTGGSSAMSITRLVETARWLGASDDPVIRQRLADVYVHNHAAQYTTQRAVAKVKAGQTPGPEMSILKLALTQNAMRVSELVSDMLGPRLAADSGEWGTYAWAEFVLGIPGMRVAGGTDEILRNIVGERVLGLPKEPKAPGGTSAREARPASQEPKASR